MEGQRLFDFMKTLCNEKHIEYVDLSVKEGASIMLARGKISHLEFMYIHNSPSHPIVWEAFCNGCKLDNIPDQKHWYYVKQRMLRELMDAR